MTPPDSLGAGYFDGIFEADDDPWGLASSAYEDAKFARTIAALDDRRYGDAFEVGCAHGVLTARLAPLCGALFAVDISDAAIAKARSRLTDVDQVSFARMAFPGEAPRETYDLVVMSEVVYYWSDADIGRAADWLAHGVDVGGRLILVHWIGETDYPQTGDDAIAKLWAPLAGPFAIEIAERTADYRLDLWTRR